MSFNSDPFFNKFGVKIPFAASNNPKNEGKGVWGTKSDWLENLKPWEILKTTYHNCNLPPRV